MAERDRNDPEPAPALAGLRVVEFSAAMAGPWIGRFLAWCGAEVIRVESRSRPDVVRLYVVHRLERREAVRDARPAPATGRRSGQAPRGAQRHRRRELHRRRHGQARARLRSARAGEPGAHHVQLVGLRRLGAVQSLRDLGPEHRSTVGAEPALRIPLPRLHVDPVRAPGCDQRLARPGRGPGRSRSPASRGRRPVHQPLAVRGDPGGHRSRDDGGSRPGPGAGEVGQSLSRGRTAWLLPVSRRGPLVRDHGCDGARVGALLPRAPQAGVAGRSALRVARRAAGPRRGAGRRDRLEHARPHGLRADGRAAGGRHRGGGGAERRGPRPARRASRSPRLSRAGGARGEGHRDGDRNPPRPDRYPRPQRTGRRRGGPGQRLRLRHAARHDRGGDRAGHRGGRHRAGR
ncbi:MAG: CoA transferase [Deltaproteobacteria bacterium]|nr:CoA transferase [Deltaproteobacteria bacterium]